MRNRPLRAASVRGALLLLVLCVAGCGGEKFDDTAPLAFVPADTPWIFANVEPVPEATRNQFARQTQAMWPLLVGILDDAATGIEKAASKHDADDLQDGDEESAAEGGPSGDSGNAAVAARTLRAVLDEIRVRDTPEKWAELGVRQDARVAFYGVGILPVLRMELGNVDAFRATIARIEQKAGAKMPVTRFGEMEAWIFGDKDVQAVMAIEGGHLVLAMMPAKADESMQRRVLGLDRPRESLAGSDALAAFNTARGYLPYGSGWVDTRRLVAVIADDPGFAALRKAGGDAKPPLDATCRQEFDGIAAKMPRVAFGYTELDANRLSMHARLDLEPALAQSLLAIKANTPGGVAKDALVDFGFAMPVLGIRDFLVAQADAVAAAPFQCAELADLNRSFAEMKTKISGMIPPPLANLSGVRLAATRFDWAQGADKPDFAGQLLVASDNPALLAGLAQMAMPALQQLVLKPDGAPVALPAAALPPAWAGVPVHVAMGEKTLALAVGDEATTSLPALVAAAPSAQGVLIDATYSGRIYDLFGQAIDRFGAMMPDSQASQLQAQRELYAMYAKWFKRLDLRVTVVPDGIDFVEAVELANP